MATFFQITLKAARINRSISQEKAAELLGVDPSTLSKWERGVSMPKANQIDALCNLYKVSYDMLIFLPQELALSQL